jgi:hypothetical protein
MSYTMRCLDSCGSLCVQIGRAESPQWPPKPSEGGFAWKNSICWPTSPTSWPFHSISSVFVYKNSITPKSFDLVMWVACYGDFVAKNRVHAAGNQTFLPGLATFKLRCYQQLPLGTELDWCQSRPPYSIHISKYPCLGPQMTTSGIWFILSGFEGTFENGLPVCQW